MTTLPAVIFIGAVKDAGAARVTAVTPYLCYARKDGALSERSGDHAYIAACSRASVPMRGCARSSTSGGVRECISLPHRRADIDAAVRRLRD